MTDLTWLIVVTNEIRGADIDDKLKYKAPEIDISNYTAIGGDETDWTVALLDWIDSKSSQLAREAWDGFIRNSYNPTFEKLDMVTGEQAKELCERIIRAHDLGFNYEEG